MPYVHIKDFRGGVDRSRPRYALEPGALWSGINGHISRGGDFEQRKAFVAKYVLPAGETFGLTRTTAGLYVFGSIAEASLVTAVPSGVNYQRLAHPTITTDMTAILSTDLFNGQIYAVAEYANGDVRHFLNGTHVADWNVGTTKPTGYGDIIRTHQRKLYSPAGTSGAVGGSVLYFSGVDVGDGWDSAVDSGAGYQNMSTHQSGSDKVTAMATYQGLLAVFARRVIQLWQMADNAANNAPSQVIEETGTRATKSAKSFGDMDAFYLSDSGIRSLRARTGVNTAGVNDVGTPIDTLVREFIDTLAEADVIAAVSAVEPLDGRFWMAIGNRIFVFSYFPNKKIASWSWYEPGVTFTDFVTLNDRIYGRAGDTIYLYGGTNNDSYDASAVTCTLPFVTGGKPAHFKGWTGVDVLALGDWNMKLLTDPEDENEYVDIGDLSGVTLNQLEIGAAADAPMIAPIFTRAAASAASISQVILHFDGIEAE